VTGKMAPSSRAQAVDRMTAWASDSWIWGMGLSPVLAPRPAAPSTTPSRASARQEFGWCRRSAGVLALAESAVGDALQQAGVVLERADVAPGHLVGVGVEVLVA